MEYRNTILGISRKKVNIAHRIMLIIMLHSSFVAPCQTMIVDYFNYRKPLHYSGSAMKNDEKSTPPNLPLSQPQPVLKKGKPMATIVNKEEKDLSYTLNADIQIGIIGVSNTKPLDDASDNLFKFNVKDLPKENTKIFLTYELFGVQDCNGVSRSINDRPSTGGYVVKNQMGWTSQREEIDLKWLKTGENKVMFSIPQGANYQYQIKNLKLEFDKEPANTVVSNIVVNNPTVNYIKDNQLYVKGFLRKYNSEVKVYIEDTPLTIVDGEYEGFLKLTEAIKSRKFVIIKAIDSSGLLGQELVSLDNLAEADQLFVPEKNFEKVTTFAKANTNVTLKADGAAIAIKDNVLMEDKEISITKLRNIDIAPMASGMINVTKGGYAYRFLPDGTKFVKPVALTIEYDEKLIPKGYNADDIKTFYFDIKNKAWVAIKRDTINKVNKSIVSLTNHFTDYVNGIIQTPKSPETAGFTPTMMNDIKAADPSSEMTIISPPEVSQKGDATISYPIKIPGGRKGLQPQLAVQYSNEGGNGWLGQGWGITIPSIAIDTRWGVPLFDPANESEIYTMGGEQLMYPKMSVAGQPAYDWMPNRHNDVSGNTVSTTAQSRTYQLNNDIKIFTPRKQGSFAKIERLGTSTKNYHWKVTATDGTINWYGGKTGVETNTVIKNSNGDIVHWGLYLTEDIFGNTIKYTYDNSKLAGHENLNDGVIFHIQNIKYNGYNDADYKYEVIFNSSATIRDDVSINNRLGVKQIEPYFLDNIVVQKNGAAKPIRTYTLKKGTGLFKKSRLDAITELDQDGKEFYTHTFDYYDDVTNPDNTKSYFTAGETKTICNEEASQKCYTVSFPVPKTETTVYKYDFDINDTWYLSNYYPFTLNVNSATINGTTYFPPNPNSLYCNDYVKGVGPTNQCDVCSHPLQPPYPNYFPTFDIQNLSFEYDFHEWFDSSLSNNLIYTGYDVFNTSNVDYFMSWDPYYQSYFIKKSGFYFSFASDNNFEGSINVSNSGDQGFPHYWPKDQPLLKTPISTTYGIPTNISVNGNPILSNQYLDYNYSFSQFQSAFQTQYPGSVVSSDGNMVTIKINNTRATFTNITLTSTYGSTANTYNFTELPCNNTQRLSAENTNKIAPKQDDWKAYKLSKEELEFVVKKWQADGNELTTPINDDFTLNFVVDDTNNGKDKKSTSKYLLKKDKNKSQWIDSKGVAVTDDKTIAKLKQLLPNDIEKQYADLKEKNKQDIIARRKKTQQEAQTWLTVHNKKQISSTQKNAVNQLENKTKSIGLTNRTSSSGGSRNIFRDYVKNILANHQLTVSSGATLNSTCPKPMTNPDLLIPTYIPSFDSAPALLGSSKTEAVSGGFYVGVGIGGNSVTKMTTFGLQFNFGNDISEAQTALIDINGDGLEDIVTKEGDFLYYKKHVVTRTYGTNDEPVITHSFEAKQPISGIDNFYRAFGRNKSRNFQITFGLKRIGGFIGWDKSKSTSENTTYFTDANSDGLMDIVRDGVVYFNRLDADKNPKFIPDSKGTENLLIKAEAKTVKLPEIPTQEDITIPAFDVVKVWEAPADGTIKIDNTIELTDTTKEAVATVEMSKVKNIEIPCGDTVTASDFVGNYTYSVDFGTTIGWVGLTYDAQNVPDKFDIVWNGTTFSSGYVGFNSFNQSLVNAGIPVSEIKTGPYIDLSGKGILRFYKENAFPTKAEIVVTAPLNGTAWSFTSFCTDNPPSTGKLSANTKKLKEISKEAKKNFVLSFPIPKKEINGTTTGIATTIYINNNPINQDNHSYILYSNANESNNNGITGFISDIEKTYPNSKVSINNDIITITITDSYLGFTTIDLKPNNGETSLSYQFTEINSSKTSKTSATSKITNVIPADLVIDYTDNPNVTQEATHSIIFKPGAAVKATTGTSYVAHIVAGSSITPAPILPAQSSSATSNETPGELCLLYGTQLNYGNSNVANILTNNCSGTPLDVKKGDRIYFRVHSVDKGNPAVNWNPKVEYTAPGQASITDANGHKPFSSSYSDGFVLSGKTPVKFPGNEGSAVVSWTPFNITPTDAVTYQIVQETVSSPFSDTDNNPPTVVSSSVIYSQTCNPNVISSVSPTAALNNIVISAPPSTDNVSQTNFYFKVISASNVDWKNSVWKPKMEFTTTTAITPNENNLNYNEGNVVSKTTVYPIPDYDIYRLFPSSSNSFVKKDISAINGGGLSIQPNLTGVFGTGDNGKINFVVKSGTAFVGSRALTITNGNVTSNDNTPIPLGSSNLSIEMMYTVDDSGSDGSATSLLNNLVASGNTLATIFNGNSVVNNVSKSEITFYQKYIPKMGSFFRQWGQFMYNPANVTGAVPTGIANTNLIKEEALQFALDQNQATQLNTDLNAVNNVDENGVTPAYIQNFQNSHQDYINSSAFLSATPSREYVDGVLTDRWIGFHNENYASDLAFQAAKLEQSVINIQESYAVTDQAVLETGAYAINKFSKGHSDNNFSAGINFSIAGVNGTESKGGVNNTLSDYVDLNGDNYPDIVTTEYIQYTNRTGGLLREVANNGQDISTSLSNSWGFGASGSFGSSGDDGIKTSEDSGFKGVAGIKGNSGAGISGSFTNGNGVTQRLWTDINGDGLSDLLVTTDAGTNVTLNAGNVTPNTTLNNWEAIPLFKSTSNGISGGLGVNKWNGSLEAGVSLTTNWNSTANTLVDINGDGLLDVLKTDSGLDVKLNLGNKFDNQETWTAGYNLNRDAATVAQSLNFGATFALVWRFFGLSFKIPAININGTPLSTATNKTKKRITDFDGDGHPDLVEEIDRDNVRVYHSKIRRTDMLKSVTNPLGGKFTIDYKVQPKDYDNPNAKWAMSDLAIEDKCDKINDGADIYKKHFIYENGKYDRRERDFYGYETVKVEEYTTDTSGTPTLYRTSVSKYLNKSYFLNGLLKESYVLKGGDVNNKFSRTENTYDIFKLNAANNGIDQTTAEDLTFDVGGSEGRRSAAVLLSKTITELYELEAAPQLTTQVTFKYDDKGRVIEYNNLGNIDNASDDYTSTITYHDLTNLNIISVPESIKVSIGSTVVRERKTVVDSNGNITEISAKNNGVWAKTTMDYYADYGNLKSITYPAEAQAQPMYYKYDYDTVYHKYVIGIENAFGYKSSATYDSDFDKIKSTTDIAGNVMTYEYDTFGRNTKILAPKEKDLQAPYTLQFEYYPNLSLLPSNSGVSTANFVPVAVTKHYDSQHPADPIETYTFMDGLARPIQVKKDIYYNNGTAAAPDLVEALSVSGKTFYDELGRAKQQFHPYWELKSDSNKFVLNEYTATYNTSTEFDELDRPVQTTDPEGNSSTMQYAVDNDANGEKAIKTLTDVDQNGAQHIITETYKDVAGKVTSTKNQGDYSGSIWTKFDYNAIGELQSYTDADDLTTTYTYDMLGRKKTVQSPDSGLTTYEYDIAGNLRFIQTANLHANGDKKIEYIYDRNRLTNIKYPDISSGNPNLANVDYTYGGIGTGNQTGRLIKQKDATGLQKFDYDNMGNIVTNDRTIIGPNIPKRQFITRFAYDSWHRLQSMTYPDGEIVTYGYDLGGNLNKMTGQLNGQPYNYVNRIDYDYFEQKTYMLYGNNTETVYNYSPALRRLANLNVKTSNAADLFNNAYGYDKIGNVLNITNSAGITANTMGGNYNHTFTYDSLNHLKTATGVFTGSLAQTDASSSYDLTMTYNNTHGILSKTQNHTKNAQAFIENTYANGYQYLNGTHKLETITDPNTLTSQSYTYDANGNQTATNKMVAGNNEDQKNFYWDESNRLRIVADAQNNMQHYIYDASGERVLKASSDYVAAYENGALLNSGTVTFNSYTTYPSAFMVVNADGVFSKHYYAGAQRIVSRLGDATATAFNCSGCDTSRLTIGNKNQGDDAKLQQAQIADLQLYMDKANKGKATFKDYSPQLLQDQERALAEETAAEKTATTARTATATDPIYYYHPDHLGTSTFLTDINGNAYQFFLNLPFGETMAEQLGTNYYNTPYKFNGKELDADTGLYYYGARYYDPKTSIWLSVDPLAEQTPNKAPYHFVSNNPINRVDPNGLTDFKINGETRTINDGNDNLAVRNVSERQFNRLQRKFENGKTPNYNRLLNRITQKNGYQVSRVIAPSWGYSSEYSIEITSYGKNNKTPYSKHEHRGFYNFAQGLQDSGSKASLLGYGLTLSVVGAEAGIPLATYGGISSGIGSLLQIGMDSYTGNYEEAGKNAAFFAGEKLIGAGVGKYLNKNMTDEGSELGKEIIKQGVGVKTDIAKDVINKKLEGKD